MALQRLTTVRSDRRSRADDWRRGLPELHIPGGVIRELRADDAAALDVHLNHARVLRFIAPCPPSAGAFRTFIRWTQAERRRGALACFGIVPTAADHAVGLIQVWRIERDFSTAEWGFALGERYWGRGLFERAARRVVDFAIDELGVHRLEARVVDVNRWGNRGLEKLGASREGVLRDGFRDRTRFRDHIMWSILAPDWNLRRRRAEHAN